MLRLGVNIDHIATLRQARLEVQPDPVRAAKEVLAGGADGIVCHLREDRRHIQDEDVFRLRRLKTRLDLEMAATPEMVGFALKLKPHMVTIVPEKRRELTTEGGLDVSSKLKAQNSKLLKQIRNLKEKGIVVSLFVDPEAGQIRASREAGADFVEIHTGEYCRKPNARELAKVKAAVKLALSLGLRVNAGHGLDYNNVKKIARVPGIEELNIGYSIIARAVFVGLKKAVREMRRAINKGT
jgi:pyridoxine 5-phosphate synthase